MEELNQDPVCKTVLISDEPASEDAFGGAYQRVATAISGLIRNEDGGKTIGLEGTWGSGKSTIVNLVRSDLEQNRDFLVWVFNTQAHKGDPLRRSFLESLIDHLQGQWQLDKKKWTEKTEVLSQRRRTSNTSSTNSFSSFALWLGAALALIPIGTPLLAIGLGLALKSDVLAWSAWSDEAKVFTGIGIFLCMVWTLVVLLRAVSWAVGPKNHSAKAFSLFSQRTDTTTQTESVESPDPTSVEFASMFRDLMHDCLDGNDRRLILVVDNLDRVERDDAHSIWSTLQIFFDQNELGLTWLRRLWIFLPYAQQGMNIFWDAQPESATSFMDKQIQVRFSVPPRVISNWRQFLFDLLAEALPDHGQAEFSNVYRLYLQEIEERGDSPSPRELKLYVNGIGALHRQWGNEFPLAHLAYFYLLQRRVINIANKLRQGELPTQKALSVLEDGVKEHLAALWFNVAVPDAQELLLRMPIEQALENANPDSLRELSISPGFWVVNETIVPMNWVNEDRPLTVLSAALAWDKSGLLREETQADEPMAVKRALRAAAEVIMRWPQFDEAAGKGIGAFLNLIPEVVFARGMLGTISSTTFEEASAPEWIDGLLGVLSTADRLDLNEAYTGGIILPTNAPGFVDACSRLTHVDLEAKYWHLIQPRSGPDVAATLLNVLSAGTPGQQHLSTVRVLNSSDCELAWEQLSDALHERLGNIESMSPGSSGPLIGMLWEIRDRGGFAESHASVQQGQLMHYLEKAQSPLDEESVIWCMFVFLYYSPGVEMPDSIGTSDAGYQFLKELLAAPTKAQWTVGPFVDLLIRYNLLDHLFKILESEPESRPFIKSCVVEFPNKRNIENDLSPNLILQHWDLFHEALVGGDIDNSRLDIFVRRMLQDDALTSQVRQQEFAIRDALKYASLLRASEGKDPEYTQWCSENVNALDTDRWTEAFREESGILRLVIDLKAAGARLQLGQAYLDALVDHGGSLIGGDAMPRRFLTHWRELFDLLGDRRRLFRERLYDLAKESDGVIGESFFEVYGGEIAGIPVLTSDGQAFSRLFEPLLHSHNGAGVEWSAQIFEENPGFARDFDRRDTVEQFIVRLNDYFNSSDTDDRLGRAVQRILAVIGHGNSEDDS